MKVKIIRCEDMETSLTRFENEINEFIKNKKIKDIKYQEFLTFAEGIHCGCYSDGVFGSVIILYEEE